jgi:hypothetical protein
MGFNDRNQVGLSSEHTVRAELERRGWSVHPLRPSFPDGLNAVLGTWRDSYGHPCQLRWQPDFLIWRESDCGLYGVDVKAHGSRDLFAIERNALNTYISYENVFRLPVLIVFHSTELAGTDLEMRVIHPEKCFLNSNPRHGVHGGEYSGTPFYSVDSTATYTMDQKFGPIQSSAV